MAEDSDTNFRIIRGGLYGRRQRPRRRRIRVTGQRAELFQLDARKHLAYLRVVNDVGGVPSEGIQKVREGKTHPWRIEGRRYLEMRLAGVPLEDAVAVGMETVLWIIQDVYAAQAVPDPNGRIALARQRRSA